MAITLILILTVLIVLVSRWYIRHYRFMKHMEKFPGPPPLPIIGNALDFASSTEILPKCLEYNQKYGGIVKLYIGPIPSILLITDYKLVEYLLSSTTILNKGEQYTFFSNWLGNGLILVDGDERWKKHRKIITPAFHFKVLEQFVHIFESAGKILIEKLKNEVGKSSINIYPIISLCTLDIICQTAMGASLNAQEDSESDYVRSVKAICRIIMQRMFSALLQYKIPYFLSKQYRIEKKCIKVLHKYTDSVVKNRKAELENTQNCTDTGEVLGMKRKLAFLDLLLEENANNQSLSDQDIRDEVETFMFAGHDTTAAAISFALYCLAENPDVQEKVLEELQQIFENKSKSVTISDLQEMKYLECVIKEVLRLYPPGAIYFRNTHEDIEYDGGILPKGITLIINAYAIHRNPEVYPDPERFDPERFTSENSVGRPPYSYVPFSAGPRNCIGQKYAILEMKAVLSMLLRHYEMLPAVPKHNLVISAEVVLLSSNGISIGLKERKFEYLSDK